MSISSQIPTSLDSIVRQNRDRAQIELATSWEITRLAGVVERRPPKRVLAEWRVVAIRYGDQSSFHVLGRVSESAESIITSWITAIDLDAGLVRTANSVYGVIGGPADGQPDLEQVLHMAAWLNGTPLGQIIGVADVYY